MASMSVQWRQEGNALYKSVSEDLAPGIKIMRYQKALTCYERALSMQESDDELSSAAKNCGMTSWKIGKISAAVNEKWPTIKMYFKGALKYFYSAYGKGFGNKSDDWRDSVLASLRGCWVDVGLVTENLPENAQEDRIITIRECVDYIPIAEMKADCFMELVEFHFHRGVKAIGNGDFKVCLRHMRECHYPLAEAFRYGQCNVRINKEHTIMENDIITHTALAESTQSREIGDVLLQKVLLNEETLNIDMVWEVIDWYKDAILKVRNLDLRLEAIALTRIGEVYHKVLKVKFRAKLYFNKALEIGQSMVPVNVTNEDWYKSCTEVLQKYQAETVQHEQEEDRKAKEDVLKKLDPEIKELNKHSDDSAVEFLKFVYARFPRKNPEHKMKEITGEVTFEQKYKLMQQAVIHFHPDRIKVDEEGLEAKVLSEEITKRLTARYENIKSYK